MPTRRTILRTGILAGSVSIVPVAATGEQAKSDSYRGAPVSYDISIHNNTRSETPITVRLFDSDADAPVVTTTYRLAGLDAPNDPGVEQSRFRGAFDVRAVTGQYVVEAARPGGETATTPIRLRDGSGADDQYVTVSADPEGSLDATTYFSCK